MVFVKVDKELVDRWLRADGEKLLWWIDMLQMAAWRDTADLKKGQFTATLSGLCKRWNATKKKVRNFIDFLLQSGRITRESGRTFSTITIMEISGVGAHQGHTKGTPRAQKPMCESDSYNDEGHTKGTAGAHQGHTYNKILDSNNNISLRDITTPASTGARTCEESPEDDKPKHHDWSGLADFFNRTMDESGARIPRVKAITDRRLTAVMARAREYGDGAVYEVITKAARSSFLNGGGGRVFVADFDWIMRPNNFPKVLEGNYDEVFTENNRSNRNNLNNLNYDADSRTDSRVGHDAGYEQRKREARDLVARLLGQDAGASGGYQ